MYAKGLWKAGLESDKKFIFENTLEIESYCFLFTISQNTRQYFTD